MCLWQSLALPLNLPVSNISCKQKINTYNFTLVHLYQGTYMHINYDHNKKLVFFFLVISVKFISLIKLVWSWTLTHNF